MSGLSDSEREWIAQTIEDVFMPYGRTFDPADGARLLEARLERLLDLRAERVRLEGFADGFKAGHLAGYNLAEQDAEASNA